jgi:hypothetical protein
MTLRLICGLILATAIAMPVSFPNPFKKNKNKGATVTQVAEAPVAGTGAASIEQETSLSGFNSMYTGGTVAHIPQYASGKLDLSDRQMLRFQYGKPVWSLDYKRVKMIEVSDKKQVKLLKVPRLMKEKRVFTISFQGDKGRRDNLVLEINRDDAAEALTLLEERTGRAAVVEGMGNPDGWWGDRYWRTARSNSTWDEANTQINGSVAQAKE